MWQHDGRANTWRFVPETFKLTPEAQVHYDRGVKALKDGGVYRDDIGQCWPAGLPLIMTRVWPIAMIQLPTAIYMISHFMNSVRIIYLDGRAHTDPDIVVRTFNGESIGRWEGTPWSWIRSTSPVIITGWIRAARRCRPAKTAYHRTVPDDARRAARYRYTMTIQRAGKANGR